jgi:hypothetical protein
VPEALALPQNATSSTNDLNNNREAKGYNDYEKSSPRTRMRTHVGCNPKSQQYAQASAEANFADVGDRHRSHPRS